MRTRRGFDPADVRQYINGYLFPDAIWKTCPWQPRSLVEAGLRQWLRCAGAALRDGQVIGMPSRAVDEAWHGFVLCTRDYAAFCSRAYGEFLHHFPEGTAPALRTDGDQITRTVVAWTMVRCPNEVCVLWDLDDTVGVAEPWGVDLQRVRDIEAALVNMKIH